MGEDAVGFWLFMTAVNLLIPLAMIGFGSYFMKKAPKKINWIFGYRTPRSMKNKETWEFAHRYAGRIWFKTGWAVLLIAMAAMLMLLGQDKETLGLIGAIMSLLQCVPLLAVIPITERALKKRFEK
jgi:uncharacterized membrane protein